MEVEFKTKKLKRCHTEEGYAERSHGTSIAKQFHKTVAILHSVPTFEELLNQQSRRIHLLRPHNRKQYSMDLTANYRLIVQRFDDPGIVQVIRIEDTH